MVEVDHGSVIDNLALDPWEAERAVRPSAPLSDRFPRSRPVPWLAPGVTTCVQRVQGNVVTSGGLVSPAPVRRGGVISAEFDGLGTVEVYGEGARHGI